MEPEQQMPEDIDSDRRTEEDEFFSESHLHTGQQKPCLGMEEESKAISSIDELMYWPIVLLILQ